MKTKKKAILTVLAVLMMAWAFACGGLMETSESAMGSGGGDAGASTGADGGGGRYDSGAAMDGGGWWDAGSSDSGAPTDAGPDGGPSTGGQCLATIDCVYGQVCRAGRCEKSGGQPDAGAGDAGGQRDGGVSADGGTEIDAGEDAGAADTGAAADAGDDGGMVVDAGEDAGETDGGTAADAGDDAGVPNGSFSCPFYPAGTRPGPADQPGTAALAFTLGGTSMGFTKCRGDVETLDPFYGSVFTISLVDDSAIAQGTEYLFVIGLATDRHAAGRSDPLSETGPVWGDIYEISVDGTGAITRAVWRGYGDGGSLSFSRIGDKTAPTGGTITPALREAGDVVCDDADPDPARKCRMTR